MAKNGKELTNFKGMRPAIHGRNLPDGYAAEAEGCEFTGTSIKPLNSNDTVNSLVGNPSNVKFKFQPGYGRNVDAQGKSVYLPSSGEPLFNTSLENKVPHTVIKTQSSNDDNSLQNVAYFLSLDGDNNYQVTRGLVDDNQEIRDSSNSNDIVASEIQTALRCFTGTPCYPAGSVSIRPPNPNIEITLARLGSANSPSDVTLVAFTYVMGVDENFHIYDESDPEYYDADQWVYEIESAPSRFSETLALAPGDGLQVTVSNPDSDTGDRLGYVAANDGNVDAAFDPNYEGAGIPVAAKLRFYVEIEGVMYRANLYNGSDGVNLSRAGVQSSDFSFATINFSPENIKTGTSLQTYGSYPLPKLSHSQVSKFPTSCGPVLSPGDSLVFWNASTVYASEPGLYGSYPVDYQYSIDVPIINVAPWSTGLLVLTTSKVSFLQGSSPDSYSETILNHDCPCYSDMSVAESPYGIIFATRDGIAIANSQSVKVVTGDREGGKNVIDPRDWRDNYYPQNMTGEYAGGSYYFVVNQGSGYYDLYALDIETFELRKILDNWKSHSSNHTVQVIKPRHNDECSICLSTGQDFIRVDKDGWSPTTATWKSVERITERGESPMWFSVDAAGYPLNVKLIVDGTTESTWITVSSFEPVDLPDLSSRPTTWQIEVQTTHEIYGIYTYTNRDEMMTR